MFSKTKKALANEIATLKRELARSIEYGDNQANAVDRMNGQLQDWMKRQSEMAMNLAETAGLENARDLMDLASQVRVLRIKAEQYDNIMAMALDKYDADEALLKRLRAALGLSSGDSFEIIKRANQLPTVIAHNQQLARTIQELREEIEDLES